VLTGLARPADAPADGSSAADGSAGSPVLSMVDVGGDDRPRFRIYVDGQRRWSDDEDALLLATALDEITQMAIDSLPGQVMLHAGAVERDGQVVVVAGDSGRGKSTLTAALVQRGYRYLTDEVVAIDPTSLRARPFAKAIDLDATSRQLLGLGSPRRRGSAATEKAPVAVEQIGAVSTGGQVALVVLLIDDVDPFDGVTTPQSPAIRSLLDLIGCTFGPTFDHPGGLESLTRVVESVPVLRLPRGPLDVACAQIDAALPVRS
jgi:hypothetical protein